MVYDEKLYHLGYSESSQMKVDFPQIVRIITDYHLTEKINDT